jgi:hypothetical protein
MTCLFQLLPRRRRQQVSTKLCLPIFYPKNEDSFSSVGTYLAGEAAGFAETLLPVYQTTVCHVAKHRGLIPPPSERQISQL